MKTLTLVLLLLVVSTAQATPPPCTYVINNMYKDFHIFPSNKERARHISNCTKLHIALGKHFTDDYYEVLTSEMALDISSDKRN